MSLWVVGFVLIAVVTVADVAWWTAPAFACSCQATVDFEDVVAGAGAAFVGEPVALNRTYRTPYGDAELWDFAVERVYAGPVVASMSIGGAAAGDSCHVDLANYGRVGVVAHWRSGHLSVGLCGIFDAASMVATLGEGTVPSVAQAIVAGDAGGADVEAAPLVIEGPEADRPSQGRFRTTAAALAAAAAVALVLFWRRRSPTGERSAQRGRQ